MLQSPTDAQVAALANAELSRRELCRRNYSYYYRSAYPNYAFGWMHQELCEKLQQFLEAVERREAPRLQIWMPPQHGKSHNAARAFIAWALGRHPDYPIILASYAVTLSAGHSRWIRNRIASSKHGAIFKDEQCRLSNDSRSVELFSLVGGGQLKAVGADGGVSGNPGRILVLDDCFAGREEADSKTIRDKRWEWYQTDFRSRVAEGGGVLIINTRWHEDDISGKTTAAQKEAEDRGDPNADKWVIVKYSAIAEEDELHRKRGEPLFPEVKSLRELLSAKSTLTRRNWQSVYQQQPTNLEGTFFKVDTINWMDPKAMPRLQKLYQAWDLALSPKQEADDSCGATMGVDHLGRFWLVDMVYGKWSPDDAARQIIKFWLKHQAMMVWFENGPPYLGIMPSLTHEMKRQGTWVPNDEISHGGKSKDHRAIGIRGIINGGNLYACANAPWRSRLNDQLAAFPGGKADDMVDALAYLGMMTNPDTSPLAKQLPAVERSQMVKRNIVNLVNARRSSTGKGRDDW